MTKNANYDAVKALFENLDPQDQSELIKGAHATHLPTIEEQAGGMTKRWDLFSRLLEDRIIRLDGEVNGAMAAVAQASLQYLNAQNKDEPIRMIINSPGGSVMDGLAIYDTMQEIEAPVHTQGYGLMASMGSLLLVAGDKRYAAPNSSIMIHQVSAGTRGTHEDMEVGQENTERLYKQLVDIYVAHCGIEEEDMYKLLARDNWLTPEEGVQINLIDAVMEPKKKRPFEHMVNKGAPAKRETFNEKSRRLMDEIHQKQTQGNDNKTQQPANANKASTPAAKK